MASTTSAMQTKITHRFIRLLSVLMALDMIENMISPALWIFGERRSVLAGAHARQQRDDTVRVAQL